MHVLGPLVADVLGTTAVVAFKGVVVEPRLVASAAKNQLVELGRCSVVVGEEVVVERLGTEFVFEGKTEGVLGVFGRKTSMSSLNAESGIDLNVFHRAVRTNEFHRGGAFPVGAPLLGVLVNSGPGIEEVFFVRDDGNGGHGEESVIDEVAVASVLGDLCIHFVIGGKGAVTSVTFQGGGVAGGGVVLRDDVIEEEISLGVDIGGKVAGLEGGRPDGRGFGNVNDDRAGSLSAVAQRRC